jgi:hypothetical protein
VPAKLGVRTEPWCQFGRGLFVVECGFRQCHGGGGGTTSLDSSETY